MLTYDDFGRLRLRDFVDDADQIAVLEDWEYMDDLWIGEALGFTEFLRLDEDPLVLRAVSLHFEMLPEAAAERLLGVLRLPLRRGMVGDEVVGALGEPAEVLAFGPDRRAYWFRCGAEDMYEVCCTVEEEGGLTYVTIMAPTPRRLAADSPDGAELQDGF